MGNKQKIVGHIEKKEEPEEEQEVTEEVQMDKMAGSLVEKAADIQAEKSAEAQMGKVTEQDDTTTKDENILGAPRRRKTQSIIALKKTALKLK